MTERGDGARADDSADEGRPSEPPVDGPASSGEADDPGAMSQDQPGGDEHGTGE